MTQLGLFEITDKIKGWDCTLEITPLPELSQVIMGLRKGRHRIERRIPNIGIYWCRKTVMKALNVMYAELLGRELNDAYTSVGLPALNEEKNHRVRPLGYDGLPTRADIHNPQATGTLNTGNGDLPLMARICKDIIDTGDDRVPDMGFEDPLENGV